MPRHHHEKHEKRKLIIVWDMDDTLVPWDSLRRSEDAEKRNFFNRMLATITKVQEDHLFRKKTHALQMMLDGKPHHINSNVGEPGQQYYQMMRQVYQKRFTDLITEEFHGDINVLIHDLNRICRNWLTVSKALIQLFSRNVHCENVLVTNARLLPTLSKLMVFGLTDYIHVDNIYSTFTHPQGKTKAFSEIVAKFGEDCDYFALGDGKAEREASSLLKIPFYHISTIHSLQDLLSTVEEQGLESVRRGLQVTADGAAVAS